MEARNVKRESEKKNAKKKNIVLGIALGLITLVSIAGITALFEYATSDVGKEKLVELSEKNQELLKQLVDQELAMQEMMATFDEIEYNLDIIAHKENLITEHSGNSAELEKGVRKKIIDNIQFINTLLAESQEQIAELKDQLKESDSELSVFRSKAAKLGEQLLYKQKEVGNLKSQLENSKFEMQELNQKMNGIAATLERKKALLESVDREIHTAYVAMGSYNDLNNRGLVEKEGGVLWLGRTKTFEESASEDQFIAVDIRKFQHVTLEAKKVELITEHPKDSYEIEKENGQIAALHITDPDEFWRVSNYLVVEVK